MAVAGKTLKVRGPGRPGKDARRGDLALLEAAQSAFAQYGFEGASLRGIAAAAGVDPALASHHFGSKDALWQAVVERLATLREPWVEEVKTLASQRAIPIETRLERAFRDLVAVVAAQPEWGMFISRIAAERGQRLDLLVDRLMRPAHDAFLPLLLEAMERGVVKKQPPEVMYFMMLNAIVMTVSLQGIVEAFGAEFSKENSMERAIVECLLATFLPGSRLQRQD